MNRPPFLPPPPPHTHPTLGNDDDGFRSVTRPRRRLLPLKESAKEFCSPIDIRKSASKSPPDMYAGFFPDLVPVGNLRSLPVEECSKSSSKSSVWKKANCAGAEMLGRTTNNRFVSTELVEMESCGPARRSDLCNAISESCHLYRTGTLESREACYRDLKATCFGEMRGWRGADPPQRLLAAADVLSAFKASAESEGVAFINDTSCALMVSHASAASFSLVSRLPRV